MRKIKQNIYPFMIALIFTASLYFVSTNIYHSETIVQNTSIYVKSGNQYFEVATVSRGQVFEVRSATLFSEYLNIMGTEYYLDNSQVNETDLPLPDDYNQYILFNEVAKIPKNTNLYNLNDELVMTTETDFTLPIQGKFDQYYYVSIYDRPLKVYHSSEITIVEEITNNEDIAKDIPVLRYDNIYSSESEIKGAYDVSISNFTSQMTYLKDENYLTLNEVDINLWLNGSVNLPEKSIMLTFDEGYESFYDLAYPLLRDYNFNTVVYLSGDHIDKAGYLTKNEVEDLQNSTIIQFGGHANKLNDGECEEYANPGYMQCSDPAVVDYDLREARKIIGQEAISFSYPFGGYEGYAQEAVEKANYIYAYTLTEGLVQLNSYKYELPRVIIKNETTIEEFKKLVK